MNLAVVDWAIVILYFLISIGIGIYLTRRAGKSTSDFFLTGRNLPWYIAGTSMVATTFAADTPLAVTELVAQNGIAGNWLWWNMLFGGILTVFFFARLWRRANILTDAEFVAIRYSGRAARFLRAFRAIYIGIFMNIIVMAWVNLAMVKILEVLFPELTFLGLQQIEVLGIPFGSHLLIVGLVMLLIAVYSSLSGLWGVSVTDTFQFIMAMGGSIVLAVFAVDHVGGISGMKTQLSEVKWVFDFVPVVGANESSSAGAGGLLKMSVTGLIAYLGIQWWASWYPGSEPGGGGYVAQRMMSAKDERHSLLATLWFQIAHYALRPWPWILVALAALIVYPDVADKGATYVMLIRDLMPAGLLGLLFAAFLAAYMSTIASQTVWGTSYIVNDFFRPFINSDASEKYYVRVSRITTFLLILFSLFMTTQFQRISDAWKFILACSGGIGLVLILRWYWWRINAWSEIASMIAPYAIYPVLVFKYHLPYETSLIIIVIWSTLVWMIVTMVTRPTSEAKLKEFYARIHPGGAGWRPIALQMPEVRGDRGYPRLFMNYLAGCILVMFSLFGFGRLIFGEYFAAAIFLSIALISAAIIYYNLSVTGWERVTK